LQFPLPVRSLFESKCLVGDFCAVRKVWKLTFCRAPSSRPLQQFQHTFKWKKKSKKNLQNHQNNSSCAHQGGRPSLGGKERAPLSHTRAHAPFPFGLGAHCLLLKANVGGSRPFTPKPPYLTLKHKARRGSL